MTTISTLKIERKFTRAAAKEIEKYFDTFTNGQIFLQRAEERSLRCVMGAHPKLNKILQQITFDYRDAESYPTRGMTYFVSPHAAEILINTNELMEKIVTSPIGKYPYALAFFTSIINTVADYYEEVGQELENVVINLKNNIFAQYEFDRLRCLEYGRSAYLSRLHVCEYSGVQIPLDYFLSNEYGQIHNLSEIGTKFLIALEKVFGKEVAWLATQISSFFPKTFEQIVKPQLYITAFKEQLEELKEKIKNALIEVPVFPECQSSNDSATQPGVFNERDNERRSGILQFIKRIFFG